MELLTTMLVLLASLFVGELPAAQDSADTTQLFSATTTAVVTRVIDGDTIDVSVDGRTERVRYIGIDTPEPYAGTSPECYAAEASAANAALVAGREVQLVGDQENTDKYDRLLRYVYVDETLVNAQLIAEGFAITLTIPPNTAYSTHFKDLQAKAKRGKVGLWRECAQAI